MSDVLSYPDVQRVKCVGFCRAFMKRALILIAAVVVFVIVLLLTGSAPTAMEFWGRLWVDAIGVAAADTFAD